MDYLGTVWQETKPTTVSGKIQILGQREDLTGFFRVGGDKFVVSYRPGGYLVHSEGSMDRAIINASALDAATWLCEQAALMLPVQA